MAHPILAAMEGIERPSQLLHTDRQIPLDIGDKGVARVEFIIHAKDETGTTLRVMDISPGGEDSDEHNNSHATNGSPRAGTNPMIVPSPSA